MSKLEESLKHESLEKLKAMQVELKERVDNNSLSFGTRAANVFKAVLAGLATGELANFVRVKANKGTYKFGDGVKCTNPATVAYTLTKKSGRKDLVDVWKDPEGGKQSVVFVLGSALVQLGMMTFGSIALNKSSKDRQVKELGYVEQELARREAVMQGVAEPQK